MDNVEKVKECKDFLKKHRKELTLVNKELKEKAQSKAIRESLPDATPEQIKEVKELQKEKRAKTAKIRKEAKREQSSQRNAESNLAAKDVEISSSKENQPEQSSVENAILDVKQRVNEEILQVLSVNESKFDVTDRMVIFSVILFLLVYGVQTG